MKTQFNKNISFELINQANESKINIIIYDLPTNFVFDINAIKRQLAKFQSIQSFNTPRQKDLHFNIKSGVKYLEDDFCLINDSVMEVVFDIDFNNESNDFLKNRASSIINGKNFSIQFMMPLVFLGFLYRQIIKKDYPHLKVYSHIKNFMEIKDITYYELRKHIVSHLNYSELTKYNHIQLQMLSRKLYENLHSVIKKGLNNQDILPAFNKKAADQMLAKLNKVKDDTAGGEIETIIINPPASLGDSLFNSTEAAISQMMYTIPSIKGITFGNNYRFINKKGSQVKDEIIYIDTHKITSLYNNNAGITAGITNGEDIVFSTTLKPSTVLFNQLSYSIVEKKIVKQETINNFDKTLINKMIPLIDAMTYIALFDLIKHQNNESI